LLDDIIDRDTTVAVIIISVAEIILTLEGMLEDCLILRSTVPKRFYA
jgi:hypothetical protein